MLVTQLALGILLGRPGVFSDAERNAVQEFWSAPGRLQTLGPADNQPPYVLMLTPAGSEWINSANKKIRNDREATQWIRDRVAYERSILGPIVDKQNSLFGIVSKEGRELTDVKDPGPPPDAIIQSVGTPRPFLQVQPNFRYKVTFDNSPPVVFEAVVRVQDTYAYYRTDQGVVYLGQPFKQFDPTSLSNLFKKAQTSESDMRVMKAVAMLESSFESFNSYDTGGLSIGFLQFATLDTGKGSLSPLLLEAKNLDPEEFQSYFRKYGIDVDPDLGLVVLDPVTGYETTGPEAIQLVRYDKRMSAVFVRAGRESGSFQAAQIAYAFKAFMPTNDTFSLRLAGKQVTVAYRDIFQSEAGKATLLDRKVNTGTLKAVENAVQALADKLKVKTIIELTKHERELVQAVTYRQGFLDDKTLSQPAHNAKYPRGSM